MPQMTIAISGANFRADHAVAGVAQFINVSRLNGFSEAGPTTARFELVRRCKQRFARYNIYIDARRAIVKILACPWTLRATLLGYWAVL